MLRRLAIVVLVLLGPLGAPVAAQVHDPPEDLSGEERTRFETAWRELGRPSIAVVGAIERDGVREYSRSNYMVRVMTNHFVSQLQQSTPTGTIRDTGANDRQTTRVAEIMQEQQIDKLRPSDLVRLDEFLAPEYLIELTYFPEDGGNGELYLQPTVVLRRAADDAAIVNISFDGSVESWQQAPRNRRDFHKQQTIVLLRMFIDALAQVDRPERSNERRFDFVSMSDVEPATLIRFTRRFTEEVNALEADADVQAPTLTAGRKSSQRITVFHDDLDGIKFFGAIDQAIRSIKDEDDRALYPEFVQITDQRAVAHFIVDRAPPWHEVVDRDGGRFAELVGRRRLASGRPPNIAVTLLDGLQPIDDASREFAFVDEGGGARGFALARLQTSFKQWFGHVGFVVRSPATQQQAADADAAAAREFDTMAGVAEAIAAQHPDPDYLCIVRVSGTGRNMSILTELRSRSGDLVAAQCWPDASVMGVQRRKYRIDPSDPDRVAQFIVGSLVRRFDVVRDQSLANEHRLFFTNIDPENPEAWTRFEVLRQRIEDLRPVIELRTIGATARTVACDVVFRKDTDVGKLFDMIADLARQPSLGAATVMRPGGAIQVNMQPKFALQEHAAANDELRDDAVKVESVRAAADESGDADDFRTKIRRSADAVFAIGIRREDGGFAPMGTAWCVADDMLATNAHVVDGLAEELASLHESGSKGTVVALGGPSLDTEVEIDRMWRHAEYDTFKDFMRRVFDEFGGRVVLIPGYDVGVVRISTGDPGAPLALAPAASQTIAELSRIGYVGFPMENLPGPAAIGKPTQLMQTGEIVALTDYLFEHRPSAQDELLLHYDLNTRGGASGSPVFADSADGLQVVALHSAGSAHFIPNLVVDGDSFAIRGYQRVSAGVSYGQRVDILHELLAAVKSRADRIAREVPIP